VAIRKSTRVENNQMIHTWTDDEIQFSAEVSKWVDGTWYGATQEKMGRRFSRYQNAVDWVMDEWRLAKAGLQSWDEQAAILAADAGVDWENMSDDGRQDFLDAVRTMARMGL